MPNGWRKKKKENLNAYKMSERGLCAPNYGKTYEGEWRCYEINIEHYCAN